MCYHPFMLTAKKNGVIYYVIALAYWTPVYFDSSFMSKYLAGCGQFIKHINTGHVMPAGGL